MLRVTLLCLMPCNPVCRDHLLSRYAKRISKELAREAAQLDMAPPGNRATARQASARAKSLLGLLTGCCRVD